MTSPNPYQLQRVAASDVEGLLAVCFPVKAGGSFFDDFPIWREGPWVEWFGVTGPEGVVACAGMMTGQWHTGAHSPKDLPLKIVRIGGVATHPQLRGKGVASVLVEALVERAKQQGGDAVALWGIDSPLYGRLGFQGRGHQVRVPLGPLDLGVERAPGLFRVEEGFRSDLLPLLQKTREWAGGVELGFADLGWLEKHRNTRWVRVLDSQDRLLAYGAFGRGMDLGLQLHDWGGESQALRVVFRWARGLDPQAELMGSKWAVSQALGFLPELLTEESACMLLGLNESRLPPNEDAIWFWGLDGV